MKLNWGSLFHLTEGGGSQPERPDSPIDIEIPFVAESEEAIADKVWLTNTFFIYSGVSI